MGFTDLNNGGGPGPSGYGPVPTPLYRYLDTDGDGTGTNNANGDYRAVPDGTGEEIFFIQPAPGEIFRIERMIVSVRDSAGFRADKYGDISGGLSTGIEIRVQSDGGTIVSLTNGINIKTNGDWAGVCYDANLYKEGSGDDYLAVRWTFSRAGYPLRLVGDDNERLEIVLNDNLSGLVHHYFQVQGYIEGTA
jgi:hypothetical protein